jgi:hypothetical protein
VVPSLAASPSASAEHGDALHPHAAQGLGEMAGELVLREVLGGGRPRGICQADGRPRSPPHLGLSGEHSRPGGCNGEDLESLGPPPCRPPHGELLCLPQHCAAAVVLLPTLGGALTESPDEVAPGEPFREQDLANFQLSDW